MPAIIRLALAKEAQILPSIEQSAAQAFRTIDELSWLAGAPPMNVERHSQIIEQSTCWVAVDAEDRPQGFLSAQRHGDDLHIYELSVRLALQGQGWGRQLVNTAKEYARSKRLHRVTLTTFASVPWNAPFYARMGFQVIAGTSLDQRLAAILTKEYMYGFAPGSRCAMFWPPASLRSSQKYV